MTKVEMEDKLMNEIRYLPIEIIEEMLRWVLVIRKIINSENTSYQKQDKNSLSASEALKNFLKKYESEPTDVDTSVFEQYRKVETDRDFRL